MREFVECRPAIVWGLNSFASANCSVFQECLINTYNKTGPEYVCDCANSDVLLGPDEHGDCVVTSQSIILSVCFLIVAASGCCVFALFHNLRLTAKRKRFQLIHDLVVLTMASTFFMICRCTILAIRTTALSIKDNVILSSVYSVAIMGMLLTIAMSVIVYCLLVMSVSNSSKSMSVITEQMRARMRSSVLRSGIIFGLGSCVTAGIPFLVGLPTISHVMTSGFVLSMLVLYFVVLFRLNSLFKPLVRRGWRQVKVHELQKSVLVVITSVVVFFLSTVVYVVSWFVGHRGDAKSIVRYGVGIAVLMEHVAANAYQLAIIFAMRTLVDKPLEKHPENQTLWIAGQPIPMKTTSCTSARETKSNGADSRRGGGGVVMWGHRDRPISTAESIKHTSQDPLTPIEPLTSIVQLSDRTSTEATRVIN